MENIVMCGTDLHDNSLVSQISVGKGDADLLRTGNTDTGRGKLFRRLKQLSKENGGGRIVLGYEASSPGFGLYDRCRKADIECVILAPTKMKRSVKGKKNKTDKKDALDILEILRGHYLAGNKLPSIWIPDDRTRNDRELVRSRLDLGNKLTSVKTQVQTLLKRASKKRPESMKTTWTKAYMKWLKSVELPETQAEVLNSMLRQIAFYEEEICLLNKSLELLSQNERYKEPCEALVREMVGVGLLSAMVFLTEMGDLSRFSNRKKVGAFVGLVPRSNESGEIDDRKGNITKQGSWRLRKISCQAAWVRVRCDKNEAVAYARIVAKNKNKKKVALVACMRRLLIRMWHIGLKAQQQSGCYVYEKKQDQIAA